MNRTSLQIARRCRPRLECLEPRLLPATRFVVPLNQPLSLLQFHSLSSAIGASTAGDVIQIEPGSVPGSADGSNGTNAVDKKLRIIADPANGPLSLPKIPSLKVAASGVGLSFLNLGSVTLGFNVQGTSVSSCLLGSFLQDAADTPNATILTGNTITGSVTLECGAASSGDQVVNNSFTGSGPGWCLYLFGETGTLVQGNVFLSVADNMDALFIEGGSPTVISNTFVLSGKSSTGLYIDPVGYTQASALVRNNTIDTNGKGTAISVNKVPLCTNFTCEVDGNDLVRNTDGLGISGDQLANNSAAYGTIDLGGGALGSPGANDLHGYAGPPHSNSILTTNSGVPTTATVLAHSNTFGVPNPQKTLWAFNGVVDTGIPLDANTAFVANLYRDYLKRTGSAGEWAGWVQQLPQVGQSGVASAIMRSGEAYTRLVDGLYQKILGRPADSAGEANNVSALQLGGTEEQVAVGLLASGEFANRAKRLANAPGSSDLDYVEALYGLILGRTGSQAELKQGTASVAASGRAALATTFLTSAELRSHVVQGLYFSDPGTASLALVQLAPNLLHRAALPAAAEVAGWVNSAADLLSIANSIASTNEAFTNS
jgi:Domain of unknown function (DUF4214)